MRRDKVQEVRYVKVKSLSLLRDCLQFHVPTIKVVRDYMLLESKVYSYYRSFHVRVSAYRVIILNESNH